MPANQSRAVISSKVHVILDPASLHDALAVEMIPLIVNLLPSIHDCFATLGKVIPMSLVCGTIDADAKLQPLIADHDTVGIYIVLIFYPAVHRHLTVTVKITPLIICALFPLVGHMTAAGIIINPFSILRCPSCRCHGSHAKTCGKSKG